LLRNNSQYWECCNCGLKNTSFTLFDSFENSNTSSVSSSSLQSTQLKVKPKELRLLVINFQGLWSKKEVLANELNEMNPDIIIGTETFLDSSIKTSEILPPNYTAFRRDRGDFRGGVIIIIKNEFYASEVIKAKNCEVLAIKVQCKSKAIVLAVCYRPPSNNITDIQNICSQIQIIQNKFKNHPIWIGGDLNLPDIDWSDNSIKSHQYLKKVNETFLETIDSCHFDQMVDFPTRKNNTLDILLSNRPTLLCKSVPYPGISDHDTIVLSDILTSPLKKKPIQRKISLWNKADTAVLKVYIKQHALIYTEKFNKETEQWEELKFI